MQPPKIPCPFRSPFRIYGWGGFTGDGYSNSDPFGGLYGNNPFGGSYGTDPFAGFWPETNGGGFGNSVTARPDSSWSFSAQACADLFGLNGCATLGGPGGGFGLGDYGVSRDDNGQWNVDRTFDWKIPLPMLPEVGLKVGGGVGTSGIQGCVGGYVGSPAPGNDASLQGCVTWSPSWWNDARTWINDTVDGATDAVRNWFGGGRGIMGGSTFISPDATGSRGATQSNSFGSAFGPDQFSDFTFEFLAPPFGFGPRDVTPEGMRPFGSTCGYDVMPDYDICLPTFIPTDKCFTLPDERIVDGERWMPYFCNETIELLPYPTVEPGWIYNPDGVEGPWQWKPEIDSYSFPCVPSHFNPETGLATADCRRPGIEPIEPPVRGPGVSFCLLSYPSRCRPFEFDRPRIEAPITFGVCVIGVESPCNGTDYGQPGGSSGHTGSITPTPGTPSPGGSTRPSDVMPDRTAPVFADAARTITFEATGRYGAIVEWVLPTATDNIDSSPDVRCSHPNRLTARIGTTTVSCVAIDDAGNTSKPVKIDMVVRDTTAPRFSGVPASQVLDMTDSHGAAAEFTLPAATDAASRTTVSCDHNSGDSFPVGSTTVHCTARDEAGNSSTASFTITVRDALAPTIEQVRLGGTTTVTQFVLSASELLDATAAGNAKNYTLLGAGKDKRLGTPDDKAIAIRSAVYDAVLGTITLTPKKAIAMNQLVQLGVKSALKDLAGNGLDGDQDGQAGGDLSLVVGRGAQLAYTDSRGDAVSLNLSGGGTMELLASGGVARHLRIQDAGSASVLSGNLSRAVAGTGRAEIDLVSGRGSFQNRLANHSAFQLGCVRADAVDSLLLNADRPRSNQGTGCA